MDWQFSKLLGILVPFLFSLGELSAELMITEFLARNESGLRDEDGDLADWIEIANAGVEPVDLDGWTLTDNENSLGKWRLPPAVLQPGERRIVFATRKDRREPSGEWHANFRLSAPGEYLALVEPDGGTVAHAIDAAPQFDDLSYGLDSGTGDIGYLIDRTPGAENGELVYRGPTIVEVSHSPEPLMSGDDVTITARIAEKASPIKEVVLRSAVGFGAESASIMRDDGQGGDAEAGDGLYTAMITGRTLFGVRIHPGDMVRWYVTAIDELDQMSRLPVYPDREGVEQSPEYFGTVAQDPDLDTQLPVFAWFTRDEGASRTRPGTRASVFFEGRFYDNIFVRQRGGATNGQSQKFNFSNAFPVYVNEKLPAVGELNLNAQGSDATFLRQSLAFETFSWVGNATCESFLVAMRLNGEVDRTGILIEQVDEDFLERHGFDSLGDLYKMVQRSNLNPVFADTITGIEKKTGDLSDLSTMQSLVDGLALEGEALKAFIFDNINLPQVINYLAVRSIIQDADDVRKNFYMYYDTFGTREWSMFPWDKDWTYGVTGDGGQHLKHPFFGDQAHRKDNANQWNMLYEALFNESATKQMYLRRLRSMTDTILQPDETPETERRFEARVDEMFQQVEGEPGVPASAATTVKGFFPERRRDLYETYDELIPDAQAVPAPAISIGDVEFQPSSGDQDEEYIELVNPNTTAVDISGWRLEGAITFTFAEGTVIPAGSLFTSELNRLYVSPNVNAFRSREESPKGGEGQFVQGPYQGHLSNRGEIIVLRDRDGNLVAEKVYEGNPSDVERYLVISEIMFHPADPNLDAEFIELFNTSDTVTLDLSGVRFTNGIEFVFPEGMELAPKSYVVLVTDRDAFEAVYGKEIVIFGVFINNTRLDNGGERIKLETADNSTVFDLLYQNSEPWPLEAAGGGRSLTLIDPVEGVDLEDAASWMASTEPNGSPGQAGGTNGSGGLLVDEDGDGLVRLLENVFGTRDDDPSDGPEAVQAYLENDRLVVRMSKGAIDGVTIQIQVSDDLHDWNDETANFVRSETAIEGRDYLVWSSMDSMAGRTFRAARLSVSATE